jgi:hypothetical protein
MMLFVIKGGFVMTTKIEGTREDQDRDLKGFEGYQPELDTSIWYS